jgi:hypothetical protein
MAAACAFMQSDWRTESLGHFIAGPVPEGRAEGQCEAQAALYGRTRLRRQEILLQGPYFLPTSVAEPVHIGLRSRFAARSWIIVRDDTPDWTVLVRLQNAT